MTDMQPRYPAFLRRLHWVIAALVPVQIAIGLLMDGKLSFYAHVALGCTIFFLFILRLVVRIRRRRDLPPRPAYVGRFEWRLAQANHYALYAALCVMPLSGLAAFLFGHGLGELHEILAWVFVFLIALHLAGVVKHVLSGHASILHRIGR